MSACVIRPGDTLDPAGDEPPPGTVARDALGGVWERLTWPEHWASPTSHLQWAWPDLGADGRAPLVALHAGRHGWAVGDIIGTPRQWAQLPPGTIIACDLADPAVKATPDTPPPGWLRPYAGEARILRAGLRWGNPLATIVAGLIRQHCSPAQPESGCWLHGSLGANEAAFDALAALGYARLEGDAIIIPDDRDGRPPYPRWAARR